MKKRTCRVCRQKFTDVTGLGRVTLCSDACRKEHHRRMCQKNSRAYRAKLPKRIDPIQYCSVCGIQYKDDSPGHNRTRCHCCTKADSKRPEKSRIKICVVCGCNFTDRSRKNTRIICSRKCKAKRIKQQQHDQNRHTNVKYRTCKWCGSRIIGTPHGKDNNLCSDGCVQEKKRVGYEAHVEKYKDFVWERSSISSTLDVEGTGLYSIPSMEVAG